MCAVKLRKQILATHNCFVLTNAKTFIDYKMKNWKLFMLLKLGVLVDIYFWQDPH